MIIGISGLVLDESGTPVGSAGAGKDAFASLLIGPKYEGTVVSLADPVKRIAREMYDFTEEQLWGPSHKRNEPDPRYLRTVHTWKASKDGFQSCACCGIETGDSVFNMIDLDITTKCYLSPRYVLQLLGTECGRQAYTNTWVDLAYRNATKLLGDGYFYSQINGLKKTPKGLEHSPKWQPSSTKRVMIPDVRFKNEVTGLHDKGAKLIRVKRVTSGLKNASGMHQSEREVTQIPDSEFDHVIENYGTLEDLKANAEEILRLLS